jgi:RecA/RadA recombinase
MAKKKVAKKTKKVAKKVTKKTARKKAGAVASKPRTISASSTTKKATKRAVKKDAPAKGGALAAWAHKMNTDRKFKGKVQVRRASDVKSPYLYRRPTGLLSLDLALGGGVHAGGVTEIQGAESVCKTFLTFMVAGQVQRIYGEDTQILIACTEIMPDVGFARQAGFCIGYDEDSINHYDESRQDDGLPPFTDEERADLRMQIGGVETVVGQNGEELLNSMVHALDLSRQDASGGIQLMVLESLGALLPQETDEKEVGEKTTAGVASMLTQFQNKMYPRMMFERDDGSMQLTSIIGISQARANFDSGWKGPKTKSSVGAFAWKHAQLACVELARGADEKEDKEVIGKTIRWKMKKGKAGTHDGKKGEFIYYHLERQNPVFWKDVVEAEDLSGIDTLTDTVHVAKKLGIVTGTNWLEWKEGHKTILRANGSSLFAGVLMDEPELLARLQLQCVKQSGIKVKYR